MQVADLLFFFSISKTCNVPVYKLKIKLNNLYLWQLIFSLHLMHQYL